MYENLEKLTIDDFEVSKSEGRFGPIWIVTPKRVESEWDKKCYVLRSDVKMDRSQFSGTAAKPGVHLDVAHGGDPLKSHDWKGIYRTDSMDEALNDLIADLNRNNQLSAIEVHIESAVSALQQELDFISQAVTAFPRHDLDEIMEKAESAYKTLTLRYKEVREEMENLGW